MRLVELLLLAVLLATPIGQLGRIPFVFERAYIYPNDILIPLLIVVWLVYRLAVRKSFPLPKLTLPIALVLVVSGFSLLLAANELAGNELLVSGLYLVRLIEYISLYFVARDIVRERGTLLFWQVALIGTAVLVAVTGFIQYIYIPDFSFAAQYGWDPHIGRLLGTFFDPNFIGGFLSLALALVLALASGKLRNFRTTLFIIAAVLFVAIILTFSRSAYLALGAVVLVIGLFRTRWLMFLGIAAFVTALVFVPRIQERLTEGIDAGESGSYRIISWNNAITVWQSSPIFGVGYNSYRYAQDRLGIVSAEQSGNAGAGSDSSMLFVLATTGAVGLLAWSYLMLRLSVLSIKNIRRGGDLGLALLASLGALAFHSQFINSLFFIWIMMWLWILVGLMESETDA